MRLSALALSLALALPASAYDWVEGSIIGVPAAGPSSHITWVAVDANRHIQIKWNRSTSGYWPQNCSYVINLRATGYMR